MDPFDLFRDETEQAEERPFDLLSNGIELGDENPFDLEPTEPELTADELGSDTAREFAIQAALLNIGIGGTSVGIMLLAFTDMRVGGGALLSIGLASLIIEAWRYLTRAPS